MLKNKKFLYIGGGCAALLGFILFLIGFIKDRDPIAVYSSLLSGGNGKPGLALIIIGLILLVAGIGVAAYVKFVLSKKQQ